MVGHIALVARQTVKSLHGPAQPRRRCITSGVKDTEEPGLFREHEGVSRHRRRGLVSFGEDVLIAVLNTP